MVMLRRFHILCSNFSHYCHHHRHFSCFVVSLVYGLYVDLLHVWIRDSFHKQSISSTDKRYNPIVWILLFRNFHYIDMLVFPIVWRKKQIIIENIELSNIYMRHIPTEEGFARLATKCAIVDNSSDITTHQTYTLFGHASTDFIFRWGWCQFSKIGIHILTI